MAAIQINRWSDGRVRQYLGANANRISAATSYLASAPIQWTLERPRIHQPDRKRHHRLWVLHRLIYRRDRRSLCQAISPPRCGIWKARNFNGCRRRLRRRSRDGNRALRQAEPTRLLRLARPDRYRHLLKPGTLSKFRKERQISFGRHSVRG